MIADSIVCSPPQPTVLNPNESMQCVASYKITQDDIDRGSVENIAYARSSVVNNTPSNTKIVFLSKDNPIEPPQCNDTDIIEDQFLLDGLVMSQAALAENIIKTVLRSNKAKPADKRQMLLARSRTSSLKSLGWSLIWGLPRIVKNCGSHSSCSIVSLQEVIEKYKRNSNTLHQITSNLLSNFGRRFLRASRVKTVKRKAAQLRNLSSQIILRIPSSHSVCG